MLAKAVSRYLLFYLFWLLLSCVTAEPDPAKAISASFRAGEAGELANYFAADLKLRVDPERIDFSSVRAGQAEQIMRCFFKKYPPTRFVTTDQGTTPHLRYATGTYWSGGQVFQISVLMRQPTPGHYRIHCIQVNQ